MDLLGVGVRIVAFGFPTGDGNLGEGEIDLAVDNLNRGRDFEGGQKGGLGQQFWVNGGYVCECVQGMEKEINMEFKLLNEEISCVVKTKTGIVDNKHAHPIFVEYFKSIRDMKYKVERIDGPTSTMHRRDATSIKCFNHSST
jgi:hypothetical protein